jgi:flagellar biosynthetic protein FliQ
MEAEMVIRLIRQALEITFILSTPLLIVSLIIGVIISILQVVTSIQDPTVALVPRMAAIFFVFLFVFPWMLNMLTSYTVQLFGRLHEFIR